MKQPSPLPSASIQQTPIVCLLWTSGQTAGWSGYRAVSWRRWCGGRDEAESRASDDRREGSWTYTIVGWVMDHTTCSRPLRAPVQSYAGHKERNWHNWSRPCRKEILGKCQHSQKQQSGTWLMKSCPMERSCVIRSLRMFHVFWRSKDEIFCALVLFK